ncbi:hypothetical protein [Aggregatibacter actinomycetemcomitans]|uniref:hypothetical protein n=1 Tax=Aggregatibacter actinomycetemcomitans TaxID=714 RepID=UPI001E413AAD|nr:hypothetical protein [Aggregatibacter actinomycetemcomitans]
MNFLALSAKSEVYPDLINLEKVLYIKVRTFNDEGVSNARALKLMQEVLEMYQPSPLLSHALTETVNGVMKNRRESRNVVSLTNHNYLKKVYEGAKPLFAVVRNEQGKSAVQTAQKQAEDKRIDAIRFVERYDCIGQLDLIKNTSEYQIWKEWKDANCEAK